MADATLTRSVQALGCCTWCGHVPHGRICPDQVTVAAGPSGGPGRSTPTKVVPCLCVSASLRSS